MKPFTKSESDILLDILDLDMGAIADPQDKIAECQYFLNLASKEYDLKHFRWLISAFLGAAHSFFDISALNAYNAFADSRTGEIFKNAEAIETLERYITVSPHEKNPSRINTGAINKKTQAAIHKVTKQLYELRQENAHHNSLLIMPIGTALPPEAFHFCKIKKDGSPTQIFCQPVLAFCRDTILLIQQVQRELEA